LEEGLLWGSKLLYKQVLLDTMLELVDFLLIQCHYLFYAKV
jgi:hypothetical protein